LRGAEWRELRATRIGMERGGIKERCARLGRNRATMVIVEEVVRRRKMGGVLSDFSAMSRNKSVIQISVKGSKVVTE
jgi:hypothetical protein